MSTQPWGSSLLSAVQNTHASSCKALSVESGAGLDPILCIACRIHPAFLQPPGSPAGGGRAEACSTPLNCQSSSGSPIKPQIPHISQGSFLHPPIRLRDSLGWPGKPAHCLQFTSRCAVMVQCGGFPAPCVADGSSCSNLASASSAAVVLAAQRLPWMLLWLLRSSGRGVNSHPVLCAEMLLI